jgi:hypothetical protein
VLFIDSLLASGIRFVLDKVATAVDAELNDDTALREQLLAAQMRLELEEISQEEFDVLEADILARIHKIRARQRGEGPAVVSSDEVRITGIEATFEGDEH